MSLSRARLRIIVNVVLDAVHAALAVLLAGWIVAPDQMKLAPLVALPWGMLSLSLAGLPFRIARQTWRFVGASELVAVAASSALGAGLFAAGLYAARIGLPSPAFPVAHALALFAWLALPRIIYRLLRETPAPPAIGHAAPPALLLGAGEGAERLLAALAGDAAPPYRALGLLSAGEGQTGRRIHGCPVLGSLADAAIVLARLREAGEAPESLIVTDPGLPPSLLGEVLGLARHAGIAVAWAPSATALDEAPRLRA